MENATDALKIAFAVLVFVMALTITITMFSQLNSTSKILISATDTTNYYQYSLADADKTFREVGLETIIPTLYKYYKEQYTVVFLDGRNSNDVKPLILYKSNVPTDLWGQGVEIDPVTGNPKENKYIGKYEINGNTYTLDDGIFFFDLDNENVRHEAWTSGNGFKKNLDCFLNGGVYEYDSAYSSTGKSQYNYSTSITPTDGINGGFIEHFQKWTERYKFKEMLGEYDYKTTSESGQHEVTQKKRVIIYKLVNK